MRYLPVLLSIAFSFSACSQEKNETTTKNNFPKSDRIEKSEEEWKKELTEQEYYVLRQKGTERAFTSDLLSVKEEGEFICAACSLPLFSSATKFKSGTGWPSFYEPINDINVAEEEDRSYGMNRTEVLCARCGGHLGHVFPDGPRPTGLRYCINGVSLEFKKKEPSNK